MDTNDLDKSNLKQILEQTLKDGRKGVTPVELQPEFSEFQVRMIAEIMRLMCVIQERKNFGVSFDWAEDDIWFDRQENNTTHYLVIGRTHVVCYMRCEGALINDPEYFQKIDFLHPDTLRLFDLVVKFATA